MAESRVLALVGSLRAGSINRQLAETAEQVAPEGADVVIYERLGEIPFYNEDIDGPDAPESAVALRTAAGAADALLLVTPEYNGTVPAVLKNAIDWLSRPFGAGAVKDKPVAVISASISRNAAKWAQDDVRRSIGIAGGKVVDQATLSVGEIGQKFADIHPSENAEVATQVAAVIHELVSAAGRRLVATTR